MCLYTEAHMGNSKEFKSMTKDINQKVCILDYTNAELKLQVRKAITLF